MTLDDLVKAAERICADAVAADPRLADLSLAGIGWATVDGERAIRELDADLATDERAGPRPDWSEQHRDPTLGARVWRRNPVDPSALPVVCVLEPDTEGRLAASLARFGEGVAVIYLGDGLIGSGRRVRGGRPWGPHVIVLGDS
jgi:hypothetical protein